MVRTSGLHRLASGHHNARSVVKAGVAGGTYRLFKVRPTDSRPQGHPATQGVEGPAGTHPAFGQGPMDSPFRGNDIDDAIAAIPATPGFH